MRSLVRCNVGEFMAALGVELKSCKRIRDHIEITTKAGRTVGIISNVLTDSIDLLCDDPDYVQPAVEVAKVEASTQWD